jgi:hypothetical protein
VGALLGVVPRKHQRSEIDRNERITKTGDTEARAALFEAAHVMLHRVKEWSGLKAWAAKVARRQGTKRATVALARKMAVVLHRMWVDGTKFRWGMRRRRLPPAPDCPRPQMFEAGRARSRRVVLTGTGGR